MHSLKKWGQTEKQVVINLLKHQTKPFTSLQLSLHFIYQPLKPFHNAASEMQSNFKSDK